MSLRGPSKSRRQIATVSQADAVAQLAPHTRCGEHENDSIAQARDNVRAAIKYAMKKGELTRLPNRHFDLQLFRSWGDSRWPPASAGMIGAGTAAFSYRPKQYSVRGRAKPLQLTPKARIAARTFSPESFASCLAEIGRLSLEVESLRSRIRSLESERDALEARVALDHRDDERRPRRRSRINRR